MWVRNPSGTQKSLPFEEALFLYVLMPRSFSIQRRDNDGTGIKVRMKVVLKYGLEKMTPKTFIIKTIVGDINTQNLSLITTFLSQIMEIQSLETLQTSIQRSCRYL